MEQQRRSGSAVGAGLGQGYLFPRRYSHPAEKVVKAEVPNNQRKRRSGSSGVGTRLERGQEYLFPRCEVPDNPPEQREARSEATERQRRSEIAVGFKRRQRAGPELLGVVPQCGEERQCVRATEQQRQSGGAVRVGRVYIFARRQSAF